MMKLLFFTVLISYSFIAASQEKWAEMPVKRIAKSEGEIIFWSDSAALKLKICDPSIVQVLCTINGEFSTRGSLSVVNPVPGNSSFTLSDEPEYYVVKTSKLAVKVKKSTSEISFYDSKGNRLLSEAAGGGRYFSKEFIGGEDVFAIRQSFVSPPDEALYGLGQFQDGIMNWKNVYVRMKQENTTAVMPVYFSNKGYGIFWHNYSFSEVNPEREKLTMEAQGNIMSASFTPSASGTYTFDIERSGVSRMEFAIDGQLIYEHKTGVYTESAVCKANLEAGRKYSIRFESFDNKINPPVPTEFLTPSDGRPGETGLKAEYFDNSSLSGEPVLVRVDKEINFDWGSSSFEKGFRSDNYSVRWTGKLIPAKTKKNGMLSLTTDDGVRMWVDGKMVINNWKERGPETDEYLMDFEAHREYDVRIEYYESGGGASAKFGWDITDVGVGENELLEKVKIYYRTPLQADIMSIRSDVADEIDYYFIYGPEADPVISGLRKLTGTVPLYPKWAYGLFMSHMAWNTQDEIESVVRTHREKKIPLDCIVQDMNYWELNPENKWGSHLFDSARYPNPGEMVKTFHDFNTHVMISIWPRFNVNTDTYEKLNEKGYMLSLQNTSTSGNEGIEMESVTANAAYDAFSEGARKMYWDFIDERLFSLGFDAWWLDATEPEWGYDFSRAHTEMGSGYRYLNAYSLMSMKGVYEGQLSSEPNRRPYILTRSSFPGQQRFGVTTWSGDIGYDWDIFKKQIATGLNFSITGDPYFTHDIGGFIPGADIKSEDYRELLLRWFQFGVFTPVFRVHGCRETELWATGPETEAKLLLYNNFRYRLLPYIYSLGADVTFNNSTIMRPLVMDFRNDAMVLEINDQYMFGPAIMVNPVTEAGVASRKVYLPESASWIDFWTGQRYKGGTYIDAATDNDVIPLFIKAGSVIPLGPYMQYATEKKADTLEIRIYRGDNGNFTLYEDENDGFNYQKGGFAKINFNWDDARGVLTIGDLQGSYPGMLKTRIFNIVVVDKGYGIGISPSRKPQKVVEYSGKMKKVTLKQ